MGTAGEKLLFKSIKIDNLSVFSALVHQSSTKEDLEMASIYIRVRFFSFQENLDWKTKNFGKNIFLKGV